MGQVTAQVEGRARAGEYLLAPAFAPEQWDVISVECTNPTMVSWMMVNHSSRDLTWSHGSYLGALQEPGEILVPSHRCQGDPLHGRETHEWYDHSQGGDLFNTLVAVNQQTHLYTDKGGTWRGGPAPESEPVPRVNMCQTEPEGIQGEPVLVTGSFQKDRIKFDGRDILVQQVNASTVTSGGPG